MYKILDKLPKHVRRANHEIQMIQRSRFSLFILYTQSFDECYFILIQFQMFEALENLNLLDLKRSLPLFNR